MAWVAWGSDTEWATWPFIGIAILFNPLVPVYLQRSTWKPIDVICAVAFGLAISPNNGHVRSQLGTADRSQRRYERKVEEVRAEREQEEAQRKRDAHALIREAQRGGKTCYRVTFWAPVTGKVTIAVRNLRVLSELGNDIEVLSIEPDETVDPASPSGRSLLRTGHMLLATAYDDARRRDEELS